MVDTGLKLTVLVRQGIGLARTVAAASKYCVLFGVGNDRFCTEVVEDEMGNPRWNSEAKITVKSMKRTLRFVVKNADTTLGQVTVSLKRLGYDQQEIVAPLKAHRKSTATPVGQLVYEAWLWTESAADQHDVSPVTPRPFSPLDKVRDALSHGVHMIVGTESEKSRSCHDLSRVDVDSGIQNGQADLNEDVDNWFVNRSTNSMEDLTTRCPEITGLSPREGPICGGTSLTIRGANLGTCKADVVALTVCGVDCLNTLRYDSPTKLRCTTWKSEACTGPIVVETTSGGRGESLVNFSFIKPAVAHPLSGRGSWYMSCDDLLSINTEECVNVNGDQDAPGNSLHDNSFEEKAGDANALLMQNAALRTQNDELYEYIDNLLAKVIIRCPDLLQIGATHTADDNLPVTTVTSQSTKNPRMLFGLGEECHRNETVSISITKTVTKTEIRKLKTHN